MGLWERLINALNPCVHQYRVIETLKDDPDKPSTVTLIRECDICGNLETTVVNGPPRPAEPWNCKKRGHYWELVWERNLVNKDRIINGLSSVLGCKRLERCPHCGETRQKLIGLAPGYLELFNFPPDFYEKHPDGIFGGPSDGAGHA